LQKVLFAFDVFHHLNYVLHYNANFVLVIKLVWKAISIANGSEQRYLKSSRALNAALATARYTDLPIF
jgi:hypothetical protein